MEDINSIIARIENLTAQMNNANKELAMFQINELKRNSELDGKIKALETEIKSLRNLINDNWGESRKKFAEFDYFVKSGKDFNSAILAITNELEKRIKRLESKEYPLPSDFNKVKNIETKPKKKFLKWW